MKESNIINNFSNFYHRSCLVVITNTFGVGLNIVLFVTAFSFVSNFIHIGPNLYITQADNEKESQRINALVCMSYMTQSEARLIHIYMLMQV